MPILSVDLLNYWVGVSTLGMQLGALVLLAVYLLRKRIPDLQEVGEFVGNWGLWLGFLLTVGALVMSLYYSEVLGFAPCGLCWMIRVFTYSQVVLFALALSKRDRHIADYSIALSIFGMIVALYQHYLQMGGTDVLPCPATSNIASDCAQRILFEFGYITFPLVGASLFAFLIVVMLFVRRMTRS